MSVCSHGNMKLTKFPYFLFKNHVKWGRDFDWLRGGTKQLQEILSSAEIESHP